MKISFRNGKAKQCRKLNNVLNGGRHPNRPNKNEIGKSNLSLQIKKHDGGKNLSRKKSGLPGARNKPRKVQCVSSPSKKNNVISTTGRNDRRISKKE